MPKPTPGNPAGNGTGQSTSIPHHVNLTILFTAGDNGSRPRRTAPELLSHLRIRRNRHASLLRNSALQHERAPCNGFGQLCIRHAQRCRIRLSLCVASGVPTNIRSEKVKVGHGPSSGTQDTRRAGMSYGAKENSTSNVARSPEKITSSPWGTAGRAKTFLPGRSTGRSSSWGSP